jgi:hypothetical protein
MRTQFQIQKDINAVSRQIGELEAELESLMDEMNQVKLAQPSAPLNESEQHLFDWLEVEDSELLLACMAMRKQRDGWDLMDCCDDLDSRTYHEYCEGW